jgi:hypothetical protein
MSHRQHFHVDHGLHSITLNTRAGHVTEIELLIDGKEMGYHRGHYTQPIVLPGELADELSTRFLVRIERKPHGSHPVSCFLEIDGRQQPIPERAMA